MKIRLIFAALAGAMLLTLFTASPAAAVEETVGSCAAEILDEEGAQEVEALIEAAHADGASDEAKERLETFEEDLEGCIESPSPIIPALNEVIWGGGAFAVLLGFMVWKGFPAVKKIMDDRADQISGDLDAADKAKTDALAVKAQNEAELADAKAEGARIIEQARQDADGVRADLQVRAEADIAEMRTQAAADVEVARGRAMTDLQAEVSDIVVGAAERVVEANLDRDAQTQLIENYINQVGSK